MRSYNSFYRKHTDIIIKALYFTKEKINQYCEDISKKIGITHQRAILEKRNLLHEEINLAINLVQKYPDANIFTIDESILKKIADTIRSSLEIYKEDISKVALEYDIDEYNDEKKQIEQILKTELLKDAETDLFKKYYECPDDSNMQVEFFISYSSRDKKLAGKIRDIIKNKNFEVFLAHRDIPLSKEWRDEILSKLESCSHLLAVCTQNYQCSTWGNQEVGIAFEKGKKVIPIFAEGTDKTRFGFLEAKQGYPKNFTEENIETIIAEIIEFVKL